MATISYTVGISGGGMSVSKSYSITADSIASYEVTLPVGKTGELTTRTDDNTGVATMDSGHGLATSDVVDVYWSGGVRYGMTATVAGDAVTLDGGAGDVLPATSTDVVVTEQVVINANIDGDEVEFIAVSLEYTDPSSTAVGHADFQESDDTQVAHLDLTANQPYIVNVNGGATNPFTGDPIAQIKASNGSSSEAATFKVLVLSDSTP